VPIIPSGIRQIFKEDLLLFGKVRAVISNVICASHLNTFVPFTFFYTFYIMLELQPELSCRNLNHDIIEVFIRFSSGQR
jgi:hypothetical protein